MVIVGRVEERNKESESEKAKESLHILPISILARAEKARSKRTLKNTFIVKRDF